MPDQTARKDDGARDTVALLDALTRGDITGAQTIIDHCDPGPTIVALASAWISLADYLGGNTGELIASMRGQLR